ncbi:uncharacterized protein [Battus philenor]|uniref:uncharacterized protein n=1 Tax=Battus philenor TaxID=42288 RepID=UPI0035CFE00E
MAEKAAGGIGQQIGAAIKKKISDSIMNVDIINLLKNIAAAAEEEGESDDITEQLQGVLEMYNNMDDNDKAQFTDHLKKTLATKLESKLQEVPLDMTELDQAINRAIIFKLALYAFGALLLLALIVFFGYKLYKSIKDKEKKREEKKKAKQMKKKK